MGNKERNSIARTVNFMKAFSGIFCFVLLIIIPLAYTFQGIDFTDTGFVLTYYQQIFNDPSSVSYWFHLWLPNIAGGVWNFLFGWGGLLSFKTAAVIIFWLTAFLVYKSCKDIISSKRLLLFALLLGMVLHFPSKITVIHYNNISMLFLAGGAYLLFRGIERDSRLLFFCSGAVLTLAVFARLPNITAMSFCIVLVYSKIKKKDWLHRLFIDLVFFFGGALTMAAFVFLIMKCLGHLDLYLNSIFDLFSGSSGNLSNYSQEAILKRFIRQWARAVLSGVLVFTAGFVVHIISSRKSWLLLIFFIAGAAIVAGSFAFISTGQRLNDFFVFPAIGSISLTCLLMIFLLDDRYQKQKTLALLSLLLFAVLSVGSDTGLTVSAYAVIFGFPLVLWFWLEMPETVLEITSFEKSAAAPFKHTYRINFSVPSKRNILAFFLVLYIAYSVPFFFQDIYRDSSLRWKMTSTVNHPLLRGVLTTPERASAINSFVTELDKYVDKDDYLLTFESIPMVHFLTKTRPYLYNPWPILYSPAEFQNALEKARRDRSDLPAAALAKVQIRSKTWPDSGGVADFDSVNEDRRILFTFFEKEGYYKKWENEAFEIFLPPNFK
jgi:hypothetical protein